MSKDHGKPTMADGNSHIAGLDSAMALSKATYFDNGPHTETLPYT
jgi:hypothetical protein